jgi:hypothetical protein
MVNLDSELFSMPIHIFSYESQEAPAENFHAKVKKLVGLGNLQEEKHDVTNHHFSGMLKKGSNESA